MPIVQIAGRTLPEYYRTTIKNHPSIQWRQEQFGLEGWFDITIDNGAIHVSIELNQFDKDKHTLQVLLRALNLVQATLDLLSFRSGDGHTFILDTITFPDSETPHQIDICDHRVAKFSTAVANDEDFLKILGIVLAEPELFMAVRDLADCLRFSFSSLINSARAIESIRNNFIPTDGKREDGWAPMREALNIARSYIQPIMEAARAPRHGSRTAPNQEARTLGHRSWIVMNRFLEFRKRGTQPLPLSEFPVLE